MAKILSFVFLGALILAGNLKTSAQLTIFNIPSTDVSEKKSFYQEFDFVAHPDRLRNGGYQTYGYRAAYGLGHKFEVGVNLYYTRLGGPAPVEIQPNIKYLIYENERLGISATTGLVIATPLNRAAGNRTTGMIYSNVSKTIRSTNGTRVTGGFYSVIGADSDFGTKDGVLIGIEQPVKGKISFIADWSSGKNRYGYASAGVNYALTKRQFILLGYSWGNSGRGNNAIAAFYGATF